MSLDHEFQFFFPLGFFWMQNFLHIVVSGRNEKGIFSTDTGHLLQDHALVVVSLSSVYDKQNEV